jgi:hypothetical protein
MSVIVKCKKCRKEIEGLNQKQAVKRGFGRRFFISSL